MYVLCDNDVGGAVTVLRRILESGENAVLLDLVAITFTDFEALGLPRDAPDRLLWQTSQNWSGSALGSRLRSRSSQRRDSSRWPTRS